MKLLEELKGNDQNIHINKTAFKSITDIFD